MINNYLSKIAILPLIVLFSSLLSNLLAQNPNNFSYQAVVRNSNEALVKNQSIGVKISILRTSPLGSEVMVELHETQTNENGLFTIKIGDGMYVSGGIDSINWPQGIYFLKSEIDITGGTNYTISGTTQLQSVPYALHANTAERITDTSLNIARMITAEDIERWNSQSGDTIYNIGPEHYHDTVYVFNETSIYNYDTVYSITEQIIFDTIVFSNVDTFYLASDTLIIYNETVRYDTIASIQYDTVVLAADTLVINNVTTNYDTTIIVNESTVYDTLVISNSDTIYVASDTLVIYNESVIYDTIASIQYDTVIVATDTLIINNVHTNYDTTVVLNETTIYDTLVINNITSQIDTIYEITESTVFDTIVISNNDTIFVASDTIVIFNETTIYDTVRIIENIYDTVIISQIDTIVHLIPDTAFANSPADDITEDDIANLANLSGTNTGDQDLSELATQSALEDTATAIRSDMLQSLAIEGNELTISSGNTITLPGGSARVPVLTTEEVLALSPIQGDAVYNSTDELYLIYNGTAWRAFQSTCWPSVVPTTATIDEITWINGESLQLTANTPEEGHGTGEWSLVEGTGGTFGDVNSPVTTFTGNLGQTYKFQWVISTECQSSTDISESSYPFESAFEFAYGDTILSLLTHDIPMPWHLAPIETRARSTWNGQANTDSILAILDGDFFAAKFCADYVGQGYDDWYLPSIEELEALAGNLIELNLMPNFYWTSTEVSPDAAWAYHFGATIAEPVPKFDEMTFVRCVRRD